MKTCDMILRGADVIDGTGVAARRMNVALDRGVICEVGPCAGWRTDREMDLSGLVLAPGFIDVHTHDDWAVLNTPEMPFKITQGVTTVVVGNCGISAAPFSPRSGLPAPFDVIPGMADHDFPTVSAYARAVEAARPAVNVRLLVGHSALRAGAMAGDLDRPATGDEIERMGQALSRAIGEGAAGLSSGLDYPAALRAPADELIALARLLRGHEGRVYTTHMRDEGDDVIESVREALETGGRSGARLVISHHKCSGKANFGKSERTLAMIDAARRHQAVALDVYPYTACSTALIERFLPLADEIKVIWSTPHPEVAGRMLDDIAAAWGVSRDEATRRLHPAGAIYFDMDEGDLQRIMAHPAAMIGSDGLPGTQRPHPRLWGTFPRVLGRYVRELNLLSLPQAIHKMTGLSAGTFGLHDRGRIAPGCRADLVAFDAGAVADVADFDSPEQVSRGIVHVLVDGEMALEHGRQTAARAGRFLAA